ncbi:PIN domain-containing protein [Infirmifilum lucidum]|nr:hypothetical protein [Infirmifilum lucidum]
MGKISEYYSDPRIQFYCETEDVKPALLIMKKEEAPPSTFNDY